jgi:hypothetical protein
LKRSVLYCLHDNVVFEDQTFCSKLTLSNKVPYLRTFYGLQTPQVQKLELNAVKRRRLSRRLSSDVIVKIFRLVVGFENWWCDPGRKSTGLEV